MGIQKFELLPLLSIKLSMYCIFKTNNISKYKKKNKENIKKKSMQNTPKNVHWYTEIESHYTKKTILCY